MIKMKKLNRLICFILVIISLINIVNFNEVFALEKPTYVDWVRNLYDYDDTVTDEEILEDKILEDEAGRAIYKNPSTVKYDLFTGERKIISIQNGYTIGQRVDLSQFDFSRKGGNVDIKYYSQRDYGNVLYGKTGTIATSGCGPTCLAMIIDSLTNANMGVIAVANWAVSQGYRVEGQGSAWDLFEIGPTYFGLKVNPINKYDAEGLVKALERGNPVAMICHRGDFTSGGHFIVLTGITRDGMITVNDPNSMTNSQKTWTIGQIITDRSKICI